LQFVDSNAKFVEEFPFQWRC